MRVAVLGNLANVGANFVTFLRRKGIAADLIANAAEFRSIEPNQLRHIEPFLVHSNSHIIALARGIVAQFLPRSIARPISLLFQYDVIVAMSSYNQYAGFIRLPFIALATGSDLREECYKKEGFFYRRGFRKSKVVLSWLFDKRGLQQAEMLRLAQLKFFRFPVDCGYYCPGDGSGERYSEHNFVVFYPTRNDWIIDDTRRWKDGLKGNDKLVKGFALFLQKVESRIKPLLILMKTGKDADATKGLVNELGIESHVVYLDRLSEQERIRTIQSADVVADHFCAGSFGGTFVEVMACGKPLIHFLQEDNINLAYPEPPPILNAYTPEEICGRLLQCTDEKQRVELGRKSREWAVRYHDWELVTEQLIHNLRLVYGRSPVYDVQK